MFPDTTTFYSAYVVAPPRGVLASVFLLTFQKSKPYEYSLKFEEDQIDGQTPTRKVLAQYVVLKSAVLEPQERK